MAHRVFCKASLQLERSLLPRFSEVLATSEADATPRQRHRADSEAACLPQRPPVDAAPPQVDEEAVVFSGNMEYHPNIAAVRFFRREIWPRLRERWPSLVWRLVGKNAWAVKHYTSGDSRIEVVGEVDEAVRELARSRVAVVPLLTGSGTRLKILEAWAAGLPVVSTSVGAEGLAACARGTLVTGGRGGRIRRGRFPATGVQGPESASRFGWQAIDGKRVYMGSRLEELGFLTRPCGTMVRYTGEVNAFRR